MKWDGVRCLFEDAQSDMLLLLDTCSTRGVSLSGSHGVKQAIAAGISEHDASDATMGLSFTHTLIEALHKLSTAKTFTVQKLYDEILLLKEHEISRASTLANGATENPSLITKGPAFFNLTPSKGRSLSLAPLPPHAPLLTSPQNGAEPARAPESVKEDQVIDSASVADLRFDEARVLVCTTFVGDASSDMSSFNGWLQNTPPLGQRITVEGMFLGPPTMLLISMPHSVWNVVQHDKVCCFLGYISSHNMIHLYQRLVGSTDGNKATPKEVEDGRILLLAREAAASTPSMGRHPLDSKEAALQEAQSRLDILTAGLARQPPTGLGIGGTSDGKPHVAEDSAEMQEAAEQLKALSHVRHLSDESKPAADRQRTMLPDGAHYLNCEDTGSSHDANETAAAEAAHDHHPELGTQQSKPKARRFLQQAPSKQDTRCSFCSHEPFKDSSSLRKHVAAAHTRPFPCAFSFAGCNSTFGSKNEWKRHIASQHLCLTYYRCSSCPSSTAEGKGNEFNRKDLFTQHLRRMHAPFSIKKSIAKGEGKMQAEWDTHVKDMQQSCLVTRRLPPQRSACPKPDCQSAFEGPGSWDEWTEHVGRHMEKGEGQRMGVDSLLARWALEEGIIEHKEDGEYRLCPSNGALGTGEPVREPAAPSHATEPRSENLTQPTVSAENADADKMHIDG